MAATQAHYSISASCMQTLLSINGKYLKMLAKLSEHDMLQKVAAQHPSNAKRMCVLADINCDTYTTYAVCPDCNVIYSEQFLEKANQVCFIFTSSILK